MTTHTPRTRRMDPQNAHLLPDPDFRWPSIQAPAGTAGASTASGFASAHWPTAWKPLDEYYRALAGHANGRTPTSGVPATPTH